MKNIASEEMMWISAILIDSPEGEKFLQLFSDANSAPENSDGETEQFLEQCSALACCQSVKHWGVGAPIKSVTLKLEDPRIPILAGAIKTLADITCNLGLLDP